MIIKKEFWKTEKYNTVDYFGIIYYREECKMNTPCHEGSVNNFHTIKWYTGNINDETFKLHHYYSDNKWNNPITGLMDINEPEPELERIFKKLRNG